MAEVQSLIPSVQEAERYYSEHVQLDSASTGSHTRRYKNR
jgi:hypothetical protein